MYRSHLFFWPLRGKSAKKSTGQLPEGRALRDKMIRVRSLATTCARECVRSATAAGWPAGRGGGSRAAVVARAFSESNLPSAQPPFDNDNPSTGPVHAEDTGEFQPGQHQKGNEEKAEDVEDLLRRHTQEVSYSSPAWFRPQKLTVQRRFLLSRRSLLRTPPPSPRQPRCFFARFNARFVGAARFSHGV